MCRYTLIIFLLFPLVSFSQVRLSFEKADSLTCEYFLQGKWNKLIELSDEAFKENIDSKLMHQRAGYAYFMTGDYTAAKHQYEKALAFDRSDEITRAYLYYSCLNSGSFNARYYAGQLSADDASKLGIKKFSPVESIDTEFNLKTNQTTTRSNQIYYRAGINTELGYRLSVYQAYAYYEQSIRNVLTQQPEYMMLLKYTPVPDWQIKTAYHHLFTKIGNVNYPADLGFIALVRQMHRLKIEVNASLLNSPIATTQQTGIHAGFVFPGKSNVYLNSAVVGMSENSGFRTIFAETAGFKCIGDLWMEGNLTLGNLKNYNTNNSVYVYNPADPTVFRTGLSLVWFAGRHLVFTGNFTFDRQEIEILTPNNHYYQSSYSGGIKWKL